MPYFLNKLQKLSTDTPLEFKINVICLLFQYELFPHLDKGDFSKCIEIISHYKENLYDKESWLNPIRKSELLLYTAIVHIGNHDFKQAKKYISNTILDHNLRYLPIMRTIRLVRLIAYYEIQDFELIKHESFSVYRGLSKKNTSYSIFSINAISLYLKRTERPYGKSYLRKLIACIMINMRISY